MAVKHKAGNKCQPSLSTQHVFLQKVTLGVASCQRKTRDVTVPSVQNKEGNSLERMKLIFPVLQPLHLVSVAAAEVAAETEANTENQEEQAAGGAEVCVV